MMTKTTATRIDTSLFENVHGRAPRRGDDGAWMFAGGEEGREFEYCGMWPDAVRAAQAHFGARGVRLAHLLS